MFAQNQLDEIKFVAKRVKNQGELAVFKATLYSDLMPTFSRTQLEILKYCAEECNRQRSGEMSVYDMVNAWNWTKIWDNVQQPINLTTKAIEQIGKIVEPIDNAKGFRTIPIFVGNGTWGYIEKALWHRVPEMLEMLLASYYENLLEASHEKAVTKEDQFYYEYENIHPFKDGNGRSGKILYNYLNNTLENPIMPPNFWGSSNP